MKFPPTYSRREDQGGGGSVVLYVRAYLFVGLFEEIRVRDLDFDGPGGTGDGATAARATILAYRGLSPVDLHRADIATFDTLATTFALIGVHRD
jgi:hypothetical protein